MMHRTLFTIEGIAKAYIGFTSGRLWNGWAIPYFEKEEAIRVMQSYNESRAEAEQMTYDEVNDRFVAWVEGYDDYEYWSGENIQTEDGIKHLYGIGAYSWIWDAVDELDCDYLAEQVEDFIYEFDTYGYRDVGIDREEMVEAIKSQLRELTVLQQVYEVWYDEELEQDERFDKLSKLLTA